VRRRDQTTCWIHLGRHWWQREKKNKRREGKGFAGLSSLVSDVDTTLPPAKKEAAGSGASSSVERPTASQNAQPAAARPAANVSAPSQPSSGSSGGKWVLGIAAVIGVFWLIGQGASSPHLRLLPTRPRKPQRQAIRLRTSSTIASGRNKTTSWAGSRLLDGADQVLLGRRHPHGRREGRRQQLHRLRCGSVQCNGGRLQQPLREFPL
jgi:hypothetical protein